MDTTKAGVKAILDACAEKNKCSSFHSAEALRLGVVKFILDAAEIEDPEERGKIVQQFMATPSWFGSNSSAARQAFEDAKTGTMKVLTPYTV